MRFARPRRFGAAPSARLWAIARLVHLNGAPAAGKTSLAHRYLADHPLVLMVDIDGVRTQLGQWDRLEESRTIARELALALAESHLSSGHDVIIPQYVGRIEFVERLETLARRCRAEFVEIVLMVEPAVLIERFRRRRSEFRSTGVAHPEADLDLAEIEGAVADGCARLADLSARRPTMRTVQAGTDAATAYEGLLAAVDSAGP